MEHVGLPHDVLKEEQLPEVGREHGDLPLVRVPLLQQVGHQPCDEVCLVPVSARARKHGAEQTHVRTVSQSVNRGSLTIWPSFPPKAELQVPPNVPEINICRPKVG